MSHLATGESAMSVDDILGKQLKADWVLIYYIK